MIRDDDAYSAIKWAKGERPSWWRRALHVWDVTTGTSEFASTDLDEIVLRLNAATGRGIDVLRREAFLCAPSEIGQIALLRLGNASVTLRWLPEFLRTKLERMRRLETALEQLRDPTHRAVLALGEHLAEHDADRFACLFREDDPDLYLGLTATEVHRIATRKPNLIGQTPYLVTEVLRMAKEQRAANDQSSQARSNRAAQLKITAAQKRIETRVEEWLTTYLPNGLDGDTADERQAVRVYQAARKLWNEATTVEQMATYNCVMEALETYLRRVVCADEPEKIEFAELLRSGVTR